MPNAGWIPVPVTEIVCGEPVALLVTDTLPVTAPGAVGANFTFNVAAAAGFSVKGVVIPVAVTPAPATAICEIWTLVFPVFVMVTAFVAKEPTLTLPKLRLVLLSERVCVTATPVPVTGMVIGDPVASLATTKLPLTLPATVGAKRA